MLRAWPPSDDWIGDPMDGSHKEPSRNQRSNDPLWRLSLKCGLAMDVYFIIYESTINPKICGLNHNLCRFNPNSQA